MNFRFLIASICLASSLPTLTTPLQSFYCSLLGNQDASPQYQTIIRTALKELHVPHADQVAIKKMNGIAPTFFGDDLSSFTAFGIWINEDLLDRCSKAVRTFELTHEAAHYARGDHQQVLKHTTLLPLAYTVIGYASSRLPFSISAKIATSLAASAVVTYGFIECMLRPLVKGQEKNADLVARELLIGRGDYKTVEAYKIYLNKLVAAGNGNHTDGWHPTIAEQAEYLNTSNL